MRMWNINPKYMCRKHLLGEHVEMHMLAGCINKNKSIKGYIDTGLVDTSNINNRHEELSMEIINRGYNHKSPLPHIDIRSTGNICIDNNIIDLSSRCKDCRKLLKEII